MSAELKCPFCGEMEFDALGLKGHLTQEDCDEYRNITPPHRPFAAGRTELGKPADGDAAYWKAMYERERQAVFQAGRLLEGRPAEGATSFAWVIETNSTYWTGDGIMFSADHLEAIRFSRKEDAQRCLDGAVTRFLGHSNGISVTEHGWT